MFICGDSFATFFFKYSPHFIYHSFSTQIKLKNPEEDSR